MALAAVMLAGCQQAAQSARSSAGKPAPQSPVQTFVTTAQPGQSAVLSDPKLGQVRVTVLKQYAAASGEYCRRYGVEAADQPGQFRVGITCYDGVAWDPVNLAL
jgi:hypothetical protein